MEEWDRGGRQWGVELELMVLPAGQILIIWD